MLTWLVPICAFFPLVAIYLGGMRVQPAGGGGVRQVLGLVLTLVVYIAVWAALHLALRGLSPVLGGVVLATVAALLALPLESRLGYLLVGVKFERVPGGH